MLAFVKIENPKIDGNAVDKDHKDWIQVDQIDYGIQWADNVRATDSSGKLNGEPSHPGLVIRKPIDKASPMLRQYCASGKRLGTVTLDIVNLSGRGVSAHKFILSPAFVSGIKVQSQESQAGESANKPAVLYEEVQFRYGAITWKNVSQGKTGTKEGESEGSWDLGANDTVQ